MAEKGYVRAGDNLWLNRASGVYYVRKSFKRYKLPDLFQSTGETLPRKAKAKAEELIQAYLKKHEEIAKGGHLISDIIAEVLSTVTPTRREGTQLLHRRYLGELSQEWGDWLVNDVTLAAWAKWLVGFKRRKKRATFMDYQKHMNLLLRYAYRQRYATHLLTLPLPDRSERLTTARVYTMDEIHRLFNAMNDDMQTQFVLAFECFMRLREALHLTWERVDLETGIVTLRPQDVKTGSKTGKGRSFKLSENAWERLKKRRQWISGPYVFPAPNNWKKPKQRSRPVQQTGHAWREAKKRAGITGRARWHDIRHTSITMSLMEHRADPVLVSEYAGVSVRTIQQVYLHSTAEQTSSVASVLSVFGKLGSEKTVKITGK